MDKTQEMTEVFDESTLDAMLRQGPSLTLEPAMEETSGMEVAVGEEKKLPAEQKESGESKTEWEIPLTPEEEKMVTDFAAAIDLANTQTVLQYGAASQKKIADFSESALERVRTRDLGEVGEMLTKVVGELRELEDDEDNKGFFGLFKKSTSKLANLKARYEKAEVNVAHISKALEEHQITLLKDVAMLDKMYDLNQNYFKELSMYILAGKKKLAQAREEELPRLLARAQESGLPEDSQAARDFADMCTRFERKIHDLDLTRTISLQMAPQIRLIQSNDTTMSDKIQSTLVNTIPLWKSQMVIAIGLNHSTEAARAQRAVSDATNDLLKKNAEALKIATTETAKEAERGIVDIETLQATNQTLITTLDEVVKIQEEGRIKRQSAEKELRNIENQMRNKLLEMSVAR